MGVPTEPLPHWPTGAPKVALPAAYSISTQVTIRTGRPIAGDRGYRDEVTEALDPDEMIARFRERAAAVRRRGLPPVEGAERQMILHQMQLDFQDFAMLGDAVGTLEDGILTLRVDLRPRPESGDGPAPG